MLLHERISPRLSSDGPAPAPSPSPETVHDAYYALKRTLLPTIIAYQVIRPALPQRDAEMVASWIDRLVRKVDHRFNGDVDHNNHRTLADSVIALWGSVSGDDELYAIGRRGFDATLAQAKEDGSLPLRTRRGSRALWYMRQTLGSLTLIAEVAAGRGEDLYAADLRQESGKAKAPLTRVSGYFANVVAEPDLVLPYAAENYIPGPSFAFAEQDLGFSDKRSNGRHYLAFMEALEARRLEASPYRRLRRVLETQAVPERPLIDEIHRGQRDLLLETAMRRYLRAALIGAALLPSAGLGSDTAVRSAEPSLIDEAARLSGLSDAECPAPAGRDLVQGAARLGAQFTSPSRPCRGARSLWARL